jgi:pSer/pThr/pTyr-binding forkhead associated (FHA) protein
MQIYIKDFKSVNGTFINGDRLSAESAESEPCELKSGDLVEFGTDVTDEGNNTIIHYKVATHVIVVLNRDDLKQEVSDWAVEVNLADPPRALDVRTASE